MDMSLCFRRLLCMSLLFLSMAAGAQTLTLSFSPSGAEREVVGRSACTTQFSINWTMSASQQVCNDLQIWASTKACSKEGPKDNDIELLKTSLSSSSSGKFSRPLSDWPGFKEEEKQPCGTEAEEGERIEHNICGLVKTINTVNNNCEGEVLSNTLLVVYKTTRPARPDVEGDEVIDGIVRVKGYDGQATIHFSTSGDYLDEVQLLEASGHEKSRVKVSTSSSLRVSGLEDEVPYRFFLKATDLAGNASELSREIEVLTVPTDGFWEIYKQNGGASGGCHSAGRGSLAVLALTFLGFCVVRRLC